MGVLAKLVSVGRMFGLTLSRGCEALVHCQPSSGIAAY
jgi:hypothetical protein